MEENLVRRVEAGDIIKPWLILGPLYEDMSEHVIGLSYFEKPGATVGRSEMAKVVEEAEAILQAAPFEGEEAEFRGQKARWSLARRPEEYLSWGTYNISNHLGAAFLTTVVTADQPGTRQWRLFRSISQRALVAINGEVVYDTEDHPARSMFVTDGVRYGAEYSFGAALRPGGNVVTVGLFRLARMAQVGFRLEITDSAVKAEIPLSPGMSLGQRVRVEEELGSLRLTRDVFYPEHRVGVELGVPPGADSAVRVQLLSDGGQVAHEVVPAAAGTVALCKGDALLDGSYQIRCSWQDTEGEPITSTSYDIRKVTPAPTLLGYDRLEERKRLTLEHFAAGQPPSYGRPNIWSEVARYALGRFQDVDEGIIRETCEFIAARKDCADFVIQGLLRMMVWEREEQRLSAEINALMKDTVLGFKYWVDEPGDTVMYMGSENHRLLFHVAEWMAGQLFPTEEFTNSRQRGLYHATKGRMYITEWLRQRGRFGFDEWHSNSYYPISIAPLINVYDFAIHEDYKLRQMAGAVLDYMFFNLAADACTGVFGTTHGRSYGMLRQVPRPGGHIADLLAALRHRLAEQGHQRHGAGPCRHQHIPGAQDPGATLRHDDEAVVESKHAPRHPARHGPARQFLRLSHARLYDLGPAGPPQGRVRVLDPRGPGDAGRTRSSIFWSCPHTSGEGSGLRPDYWSGHTTLPRVIQHRNVMSLTWRLTEYAWMTHCFFEQERFDEVRFEGNWAFGRVGQGYVGIYSQHGMRVGG